jgi:hypothetical protein
MSYEALTYQIRGLSPILLHNGQTANPLNHYAKEIKKISSKRNKTDADIEQMMMLEWQAGLYVQEKVIGIPDIVLLGMMTSAAKKVKKGQQAKSGIFIEGFFPLRYEGPKDLKKLWEDEKFRLTVKVTVNRNSIMRTRPKFDKWSLEFGAEIDTTLINTGDFTEILKIGGKQIGLGDWRPRYGRFEVVS